MQIMKVSMSFDFVLRLLSALGDDSVLEKTGDLSRRLQIPYNHLIKIVHQLYKHKIVITKKGRYGGVCLAQSARELSLADLYQLFEHGRVYSCLADPESCHLYKGCRIMPVYSEMEQAFKQVLAQRRIKDIIRNEKG